MHTNVSLNAVGQTSSPVRYQRLLRRRVSLCWCALVRGAACRGTIRASRAGETEGAERKIALLDPVVSILFVNLKIIK